MSRRFGTKTFTLDGATPALDGSTMLEGDYGWIKLNADGSYTYTLTPMWTVRQRTMAPTR